MGTEALPNDGGARSNGKAKPTTFETLTVTASTTLLGNLQVVPVMHGAPTHLFSRFEKSVLAALLVRGPEMRAVKYFTPTSCCPGLSKFSKKNPFTLERKLDAEHVTKTQLPLEEMEDQGAYSALHTKLPHPTSRVDVRRLQGLLRRWVDTPTLAAEEAAL